MLHHPKLALIIVIGWVVSAVLCADDDRQAIKIQARYQIQTGTRVGRVIIVCEIPEGHHIYSTQQTSPPGPTKIQIADSDKFKLMAGFSADRPPTVTDHDPIFETRLEQFSGKVAFTAPLQLAKDVELEKLAIDLTINCQVCSDSGCILVRNKRVIVRFDGYFDPEAEKAADPKDSTKDTSSGKDD